MDCNDRRLKGGGRSTFGSGQVDGGRALMLNGRRQPSLGRTSRVNREVYARFCERLAVRVRGPTRQSILGRRWSIEHAFLPRQEHYARINRLGVLVAAQDHLYLAGPSQRKYWG